MIDLNLRKLCFLKFRDTGQEGVNDFKAGVSGHYLIVLTLSVFLLKRALLCSYLLNPRDDQDLIRLPQINGSKW